MEKSSNIPPPIICVNDRALLHYAVLDESVGYTAGHGLFFVGGKEIGRVPCLAICRDKDSPRFTLYYCDSDWGLVGVAADYESVDGAKRRAERIYPRSSVLVDEQPISGEQERTITRPTLVRVPQCLKLAITPGSEVQDKKDGCVFHVSF